MGSSMLFPHPRKIIRYTDSPDLESACQTFADGIIIPFDEETDDALAQKISRVRICNLQSGLPTAIIAEIPWNSKARPSGIAVSLAKGVDWILATSIYCLEDINRIRTLIQMGDKDIPLLARIPPDASPTFIEELISFCDGITGSAQDFTKENLAMAHGLGKLTILEVKQELSKESPFTHAQYFSSAKMVSHIEPELAPDSLCKHDILWAADQLRSRKEKAKLVILCENIKEASLANSISFRNPAIVVCTDIPLLRSSNLFRGYPAIIESNLEDLPRTFLSCYEKLTALRFIQMEEELIFVTRNLSSIQCWSP